MKTNPLLKFYKEYLKNEKFRIFFAIVFALLAGCAASIGPNELGKVTTKIIEGITKKVYGTGGIDFTYINNLLLMVLGLFIIGLTASNIQGKLISKSIQNAISKLRNAVNKKINKLPISYFENKDEKNILTIIDKDIELIGQYFTIIVNEILTCVSIFLMIVVVMFTINVAMAIITVIMIPMLYLVISIISGKVKPKNKSAFEKNDKLSSYSEEVLSNRKLIDSINNKEKILNRFERLNKSLGIANEKNQTTSMLLEPLVTLVGDLNYLIIAFVGANLVIKGIISIGDIQTFIFYNRFLSKPVYMVGEISSIVFSIIEALNRIFDLLDEEEIISNAEDNHLVFKNGDISINNLCFNYSNEIEILKNINIKVDGGKKIAIVGKTGSGKTTLIKLLMKFYDGYKGEILLDNNEISKISTKDLRDKIGIVLQNNYLFEGTIKDNIKYGKQDATDEEIEKAAKIAQVHDYIESLPNKYDTFINENSNNISMGQKQLICIARMILKEPQIILLDEATNLIDIETEKKLQIAMNEIMKNKTCIIVAHRLSTIVDSDEILVVESGQIKERGKHEDLIKLNGLYARYV